MATLKTYMHISDLHFAGPNQRSWYDPIAQYLPFLDGLVGHDPGNLFRLEGCYKLLRKSEPDLELVVTGDLTAQSINSEFDEAENFLGRRQSGFPFSGLGNSNWAKFSVPGNHDQWPGKPFTMLGHCNARVRAMYPYNASIVPSVSLPNGVPVVFLALNGDADVGPFSSDRFLARGSLVSAIQTMRRMLRGRNTHEIRILLLHHSVEFPGKRLPGLPHIRALEIDDLSRNELAHLIEEFDIRVILTGHAHEPFHVGFVHGLYGRAGFGVLEARCGTTTQRLANDLNNLLVHRIMRNDVDGSLWWHSALYVHRAAGTEQVFSAAGAQFGNRSAQGKIQIYP
ncbi:Calcineurin-like phosphoesterase [Burkholderia sp. YR290]|nr:Calcineurin-like phosphoesterase [Burkholderia sp. YR290]